VYHDDANSVDGRNNYWGTTATDEMNAGNNPKNIGRIYDVYNDASKGAVDYASWLNAAMTIPTDKASAVIFPYEGSIMKASVLTIKGCAVALAGVKKVEVSTNGGTTWSDATGKESWSYTWSVPGDGTYTILSRVTDNNDAVETPGAGHTVTIDSTLPTTSGTLSNNETWRGTVVVTET